MLPGALTAFLLLSFATAASPGPSWAFVSSVALAQGRLAGAMAILGNTIGILCHGLFVCVMLALLIGVSDLLLNVLRVIGAAYLMWLGIQAWRAGVSEPGRVPAGNPVAGVFLQGVVVNLTNPKTLIMMLAILPQFVEPARGAVTPQVLALAVIHATVATGVLSSVLLAVTVVAHQLRTREGALLWLRRGCGVVLIGFGLGLLFIEVTV